MSIYGWMMTHGSDSKTVYTALERAVALADGWRDPDTVLSEVVEPVTAPTPKGKKRRA